MTKKIIHFVLGKANPNNMNGINKSAHNLAKFQAQAGVETEIWGLTPDPHAPTPKREYPLRLFRKSRFRVLLPIELLKDIKELDRSNTVFHFHGALIPEFYPVVKLLNRLGIPIVISPRSAYNSVTMAKNRLLKVLYFRLFDKQLLESALSIHALTMQEKKCIQKLFPNNKTVVVPNGEDEENLNFDYQNIRQSDPFILGFCGRIQERLKGLDILLEGFNMFLKQGNSGKLWLIGDGPSRKKLELYVQKNLLENHVTFFGHLHGEEKLNKVKNMDLFVHSSRSEGIPNSVLEAAALRVPLLLSDGTNMLEDVEKWGAGLTLKQNTPEEISSSLSKFLGKTPEEIHQFGENARQMIDEKYSYKKVASQLIKDAYHIEPN